jgi:ATP-dependent DNA helicase RecG
MGVQAFVICPIIMESEIESMKEVKAATSEYAKLKKIFTHLKLGLLHGKLSAKDKATVMEDYKNGKSNILVSTAVVEVGIDVENATIMIIEGAERFGLAQLHQLRGRVGRGKIKSYCLLFTESKSRKIYTRLSALQKTLSGFELAELDLEIRGPGEVFGKHQHGFFDLRVANWQDTNLIKETKKLATEATSNPHKYPILLSKLNSSSISPN